MTLGDVVEQIKQTVWKSEFEWERCVLKPETAPYERCNCDACELATNSPLFAPKHCGKAQRAVVQIDPVYMDQVCMTLRSRRFICDILDKESGIVGVTFVLDIPVIER